MSSAIDAFKQNPLALPAFLVPSAIMLIFSIFNLTAAVDSTRVAAAFNLGVVDQDEGLTFPPIKVASRMLEGLGGNLPFQVMTYESPEAARIALEAGIAAAVVIFPPSFSTLAVSEDDFEIEIWNTQHLTIAETQVAAQLPGMLQMAMSAGVANLRLSLAKGKLPSSSLPVTAKVETLHAAGNGASLAAPFIMTFTSWLAGVVGAILLFLATNSVAIPRMRTTLRITVPVVSLGIASLVLTLVVASVTGNWGAVPAVWGQSWLVSLCVSWLSLGVLSIIGMASVVLLLPLAFYQSAVGGAMAPTAAAAPWLRPLGEAAPFDQVGAAFRASMHGGDFSLPFLWLLSTAGAGIVAISLSTLKKTKAK